MGVSVTHTKGLSAPDSGAEDKIYGEDYVSTSSHAITGMGNAATMEISSVRLTSSFIFSTTTSTFAITGLAFTVSNTHFYQFEYGVMYASVISTTGFRLGLTAPAGTLSAGVWIPSGVGAAATLAEIRGNISTTGDSVMTTTTPVASTKYFAKIEGIFAPTANGTLQATYATEVAGSSVSTFAGSYGVLTRL